MNIIDTSECSCGAEREDLVHYFFQCPLYFVHRNVLQNTLFNHEIAFNLKTVLKGSNKEGDNRYIILAVQDYIIASARFP